MIFLTYKLYIAVPPDVACANVFDTLKVAFFKNYFSLGLGPC
jgi:hypothetical protein